MTKIESKYSPKSFLKSRRPERFSDSITKEIGRLDRSVLEYQLATLNKRNMELAFESFAKQLCEKVICPNLLEQTGPVAGGDGKVDTQTFPVSAQTKMLWYIGVNDRSHEERWAFAVSTQENWKEKCKKDIRKIKATGRGYKKAFFVTNMYTKANQRSEIEDALSQETEIDVRILDISWILDQIFKNGYEQLAIDTLSIDIDWRREVEVGASDYAKNIRLNAIKNNIRENIDPSNILPYQLNWLLEEAIISKELEHSSIETRGLFERAIKASELHGTKHHLFSTYYQYAWASYWWYEDMVLFENLFFKCIDVAKEIDQSGQWGDIFSLLCLYTAHIKNNNIKPSEMIINARAEINEILNKMSLRDERPSNSLMSRAYIELIKLQDFKDIEEVENIFSELLTIVKEGECLVGFPFNDLYELITELDSLFGELSYYEALLDYFTEQASCRGSETNCALLWLKRGAKRLESGEPYQAIKLIGKSLIYLYKNETKKDLYVALNILSIAYQQAGLLWASRANALLAASIITDDFWKTGDVHAVQAHAYIRLALIELQLGRLNYALSWLGFVYAVNSKLENPVVSENEFQKFDAFLSQCILNVSHEEINLFNKLPDLLERYQLHVSRAILLHTLGYEGIIKNESEWSTDQEYVDFLKMLRDVDLGAAAPNIMICNERYTFLKSSVMGCEIKILFPFRSPLVELAETILSVIEGFFSTCIVDEVIVLEPRIEIEVTADDGDQIAISHEVDTSGAVLKIDVLCSSFTSEMLNVSGQGEIKEWLHRLLLDVIAHIARPLDQKMTFEKMLRDDKALERSISFGACFVGLHNIMGAGAVAKIKELLFDEGLKIYKLQRTESWDKEFPKVIPEKNNLTNYKPGQGEPPEGLFNNEALSHNDVKLQNLIKIRLWDKALWRGTGFAMYPDGTLELTLLFENEKAAQSIFEDLECEVGKVDTSNRLKISIIRGINKASPSHYRVCISDNLSFDGSKRVHAIARVNTMEPSTSDNLNRFLSAYKINKKYVVSYGVVYNNKLLSTSSRSKKSILKFDITVVDAWKIGPNDIEVMAVKKDDDPIIPNDIENPPILETLKRKFF